MATSCSVEQLVVFLSDQERDRAAKYKIAKPRDQFIFGRAVLRQLLGRLTDTDARDVLIDQHVDGKPYMLGSATPHFNLSHSENLIAIAVAPDRSVGVDVELVHRYVNYEAISAQFFNSRELEQLAGAPLENQLDKFFELWTIKEALMKGSGIGWSKSMETNVDEFERATHDWRVETICPVTDAWLSIAAQGNWRLRLVEDH